MVVEERKKKRCSFYGDITIYKFGIVGFAGQRDDEKEEEKRHGDDSRRGLLRFGQFCSLIVCIEVDRLRFL